MAKARPTSKEPRESQRIGVLFVCTGNICRSPLAEAIFRHLAARQNIEHLFDIASCGIGGWHAGEDADPRTVAIARRYGVPMQHTARKINPHEDFSRFEWVIAMDRSHERFLSPAAQSRNRIHMMREFDPTLQDAGEAPDVPDPYYGGSDGFELMYQMLERACAGLLSRLTPPPP